MTSPICIVHSSWLHAINTARMYQPIINMNHCAGWIYVRPTHMATDMPGKENPMVWWLACEPRPTLDQLDFLISQRAVLFRMLCNTPDAPRCND